MSTSTHTAIVFPSHWAKTTIGECFFDIRKGLTTPQSPEGRGIPVTRIDTIRHGMFDHKRLQYVDGIDAPDIERYRYEPGDIAFSSINDAERIGSTALYTGEPEVLLHGMNLLLLRPGHTLIHPRYLYWYMQTRRFRQDVRDRSIPSVNQRVINQAALADIPIPLAPYREQVHIVEKIEHLLAKVRICRRRLQETAKTLSRLRLSILASACSGRLTEDWREANMRTPTDEEYPDAMHEDSTSYRKHKKHAKKSARTGSTPIEEVLDTPVAGWSALALKSLVAKGGIFEGPFGSTLKASDYTDSGVRVIGPENVGFLSFNAKPERYISEEKFAAMTRHAVNTGDLLFSSVVGDSVFCCLLPELSVQSMLRMNCFCIRPLPELVNKEYLMIQLCGAWCAGQLRAFVAESGRSTVTMAQLRSVLVPMCPLREQEEIVRRVRSLLGGMTRFAERYSRVTAYTDTLELAILDKAFRGELVASIPDDEPASVLRERLLAQKEHFLGSQARRKRRKKAGGAAE